MSLFLVPAAYLVIAPLLLARVRQERLLFWFLLSLLLIGLALSESVAMGLRFDVVWRMGARLFEPFGKWLLGPQGG